MVTFKNNIKFIRNGKKKQKQITFFADLLSPFVKFLVVFI